MTFSMALPTPRRQTFYFHFFQFPCLSFKEGEGKCQQDKFDSLSGAISFFALSSGDL